MPTITTKELTTPEDRETLSQHCQEPFRHCALRDGPRDQKSTRRFGLDRKRVRAWRRRWLGRWPCRLSSALSAHPRAPHCGLDRSVDRARPPEPRVRGGPHPHLARPRPSDPGRRRHDSPHLPPAWLPVALPQTRTPSSATDALQSRAAWRLCAGDVKEVKVGWHQVFPIHRHRCLHPLPDPPSLSPEKSPDQPHVLDHAPDRTAVSHPKTASR